MNSSAANSVSSTSICDGREGEVQSEFVVTWAQMPRSPEHGFYDELQSLLVEDRFGALAETTCKPYYAAPMSAASSGAVRISIRCGISCGSRTGTRFRITLGFLGLPDLKLQLTSRARRGFRQVRGHEPPAPNKDRCRAVGSKPRNRAPPSKAKSANSPSGSSPGRHGGQRSAIRAGVFEGDEIAKRNSSHVRLQGRGRRRHRQCRPRDARHSRRAPLSGFRSRRARLRRFDRQGGLVRRQDAQVQGARALRLLRHRHLPDVGGRRGVEGMVAEDRRAGLRRHRQFLGLAHGPRRAAGRARGQRRGGQGLRARRTSSPTRTARPRSSSSR